jgi:acyl carrier protein
MIADYVRKIKKVIADKTGHDVDEVGATMYFEDDLNIGEMDLLDILEELEDVLHVDLVEEKDNIETVGDLIDIVQEQVE